MTFIAVKFGVRRADGWFDMEGVENRAVLDQAEIDRRVNNWCRKV
jgi:hypothetical protein